MCMQKEHKLQILLQSRPVQPHRSADPHDAVNNYNIMQLSTTRGHDCFVLIPLRRQGHTMVAKNVGLREQRVFLTPIPHVRIFKTLRVYYLSLCTCHTSLFTFLPYIFYDIAITSHCQTALNVHQTLSLTMQLSITRGHYCIGPRPCTGFRFHDNS